MQIYFAYQRINMLSATYIVTFVVFLMEALFHFNLGKYGTISLSHLSVPQGQELVDIIMVLTVFSAINAYLVPIVTEWMGENKAG